MNSPYFRMCLESQYSALAILFLYAHGFIPEAFVLLGTMLRSY